MQIPAEDVYASPLKREQALRLVRSLPGLGKAEVELCYIADQSALLHPDTLRPLAYRAQAVVVRVPRPGVPGRGGGRGPGWRRFHVFFVREDGRWRVLQAAEEVSLESQENGAITGESRTRLWLDEVLAGLLEKKGDENR
ncbi:hypothetical protein [Ammonifex thiophilus]|uniref:Uncharacterized protein n=1 Tax=Ammonifex thiophilus TaxID=444093 RepID=A0A3D8P2C6_9THEO|nr:hypothetical protein [Ammonifex thiophilus]RDV80409.1 hypothetical protein DXX99_10910 [Ammonifex thiophilus]